MKKFLISICLFVIILSIFILFASCGASKIVDNSDYVEKGSFYYGDNVEEQKRFTVTTNSQTDDYGLAGTYTMLKNEVYSVGDKVELIATVNEGYNFEGWYIEEKSGTGYYNNSNYILLNESESCTYTMQSKNVTIVACFSSYTITTSSSNNIGGTAGSFTRLNSKKISDGEKVKLTATVNDGYNFEGWYIGNSCVSRNLTYDYSMKKENVNIEARYSAYQVSTVAYAKNSEGENEASFRAGTYTTLSNYNVSAGKSVQLRATVNDGYNFVGWYIGDTCVSTEFEYTYVMDKKNVTIAAVYVYYTLTTTVEYGSLGPGYTTDNLSASAGQYISPVYIDQKVSVGTKISLMANEVIGWKFIGWMRSDGGVLSYNRNVTFNMQAGDLCIFALYYDERYA